MGFSVLIPHSREIECEVGSVTEPIMKIRI